MYKDTRLFGAEKWYHTAPEGANMRIPDELLHCVCFLCVKITSGPDAGRFIYFGTGFFVGVPHDGYGDFIYLFTAKHIIDEAKRAGYDSLFVRLNRRDGSAEHVDLGSLGRWAMYRNNAYDIALTPFAPDFEVFNITILPYQMMIDNDVMEERSIGIGDEIFTVGLFTQHAGRSRNIPIVRSGILSAMPHDPLVAQDGSRYAAYLIELRSIGGISGSPVFVYLDARRAYKSNVDEGKYQILFLGMIRGHWDLKKELGTDAEVVEYDVPMGHVKGENLNTGIAVVTPSQHVLMALESPTIKGIREAKMKEVEKENQITEDSGQVAPEAAAPVFTQEMFEADLKKATRRISQSDQGTKETSE